MKKKEKKKLIKMFKDLVNDGHIVETIQIDHPIIKEMIIRYIMIPKE